jgi:hypothetical protein
VAAGEVGVVEEVAGVTASPDVDGPVAFVCEEPLCTARGEVAGGAAGGGDVGADEAAVELGNV